jgi:hypothetical protein
LITWTIEERGSIVYGTAGGSFSGNAVSGSPSLSWTVARI